MLINEENHFLMDLYQSIMMNIFHRLNLILIQLNNDEYEMLHLYLVNKMVHKMMNTIVLNYRNDLSKNKIFILRKKKRN